MPIYIFFNWGTYYLLTIEVKNNIPYKPISCFIVFFFSWTKLIAHGTYRFSYFFIQLKVLSNPVSIIDQVMMSE